MSGLGMAATPHAKSRLDLRNRVEVVAAHGPTAARRMRSRSRSDSP